jgi:hypothetical protein
MTPGSLRYALPCHAEAGNKAWGVVGCFISFVCYMPPHLGPGPPFKKRGRGAEPGRVWKRGEGTFKGRFIVFELDHEFIKKPAIVNV